MRLRRTEQDAAVQPMSKEERREITTEDTEEKEKIINEQRATRTAESILQRSLTTLLAMSD
ncbi:MAG: hypothetical protein LBI28_12495 [Treponema sp.]|jgi:hypothetical protein|nr:hypothetical protein [Treponema sp.]